MSFLGLKISNQQPMHSPPYGGKEAQLFLPQPHRLARTVLSEKKNGHSVWIPSGQAVPRISEEKAKERRRLILEAARRCFVRSGFHRTTMSDIRKESGVSAGGIYVWFRSKHEIVKSLSSRVAERPKAKLDAAQLWAMYRHLQTDEGGDDAQLDLTLWAEAGRDPELREMVSESMNAFRSQLLAMLKDESPTSALLRALPASAWAGFFEAVVLGMEVQRALGRPGEKGTGRVLRSLLPKVRRAEK